VPAASHQGRAAARYSSPTPNRLRPEFKLQRAASLYALLNAWNWCDYIVWYSFHK